TLTVRDSDMVVFGDSNAFSYGVDHKHSFPQLIPDLKVKAIGVPGYNMVQELLLMERLAPQLKGKLVVWFCYIGNDLYDNLSPEMLRYRCPFVRLSPDRATWEIVTSHLSAESWRCSTGYKTLRRRGYPVIPSLHSDNLLSKRAYSACEALIERGHKLCTEYKCHLVIMSLPDPFALKEDRIERARETYQFLKELDAGYPDHKLRAICAKSGISFVALRQHLDQADYKTSHDHWTERGHRRVAEVLQGLYREHSGSRIDPNGLMDLVCSEPGCAL
ncbi:MAG: SGNH/GDSL hydrolase family protein, partial [Nitrospiraceae bacterium]